MPGMRTIEVTRGAEPVVETKAIEDQQPLPTIIIETSEDSSVPKHRTSIMKLFTFVGQLFCRAPRRESQDPRLSNGSQLTQVPMRKDLFTDFDEPGSLETIEELLNGEDVHGYSLPKHPVLKTKVKDCLRLVFPAATFSMTMSWCNERVRVLVVGSKWKPYEYALKIIMVQGRRLDSAEEIRTLWKLSRNELTILNRLNDRPGHANIVTFYQHWVVDHYRSARLPGYVVLQFEYLSCTLWDHLQRYGPLEQADEVRRLFQHLTSGLNHLHRNSIVHHDVKPQNIMIQDASCLRRDFHYKIIDFGLACVYLNATSPMTTVDACKEVRGTAFYMCYQKLNRVPFNPYLSDVYSLGIVVLLAMVELDLSLSKLKLAIFSRRLLTIPGLSRNFMYTIRRMIDDEECNRPFVSRILDAFDSNIF